MATRGRLPRSGLRLLWFCAGAVGSRAIPDGLLADIGSRYGALDECAGLFAPVAGGACVPWYGDTVGARVA